MSKKAMELVDSCRTPVRRQIILLAQEAENKGSYLTAKDAQRAMGYKRNEKLSSISYHVRELCKAGALRDIGGERRRGAFQVHYVPSEKVKATMIDTVALDQIAELIETDGKGPLQFRDDLLKLIRATGRPVEA